MHRAGLGFSVVCPQGGISGSVTSPPLTLSPLLRPPCTAQVPARVPLAIQDFCRTLVPPQPLSFSSKLPTTSPKPLNSSPTGPAPQWLFHRTSTFLGFGPVAFHCHYLTQNTICGFVWDWLCFISGLLSSVAARCDSGAKSRVAGHQLVCPGWE